MGPNLSSHEINRRAEKLGPWWFRFERDDAMFGGTVPRDTEKTELCFRRAERLGLGIRTVLELDSHEGSQTLQPASYPSITRVLGLEGGEDNLASATFVREVYGCHKIEFRPALIYLDADEVTMGSMS